MGLTAVRALPVLPAFRPVFPRGGLDRGAVVRLDTPGALGLALVAGATGAEGATGWAAVVGMPEFGVVAAAEMGADLERLLLVEAPGRQWPEAVAALADATDLVLLRPADRPTPTMTRRLNAVVRRHDCVLAVTGEWARAWEGASLRLAITESEWTGLAPGHGHLTARRARVTAAHRAAPDHHTWLWLPGPDGTVTEAEPPAVAPAELPSVRRIA
ncbi:MAG TPA: hypothetical protein VGL93_01810 [Streptosporangiaceae bacterium]|jgi:hypothetical protein